MIMSRTGSPPQPGPCGGPLRRAPAGTASDVAGSVALAGPGGSDAQPLRVTGRLSGRTPGRASGTAGGPPGRGESVRVIERPALQVIMILQRSVSRPGLTAACRARRRVAVRGANRQTMPVQRTLT